VTFITNESVLVTVEMSDPGYLVCVAYFKNTYSKTPSSSAYLVTQGSPIPLSVTSLSVDLVPMLRSKVSVRTVFVIEN
jgi:hypothetical protein